MTSVVGTPLRACSDKDTRVTGYNRDGMCDAGANDTGSHNICLRRLRDTNFCATTGQDDWCRDVDNWCVCEWAFDSAVALDGCDAYEIKCEATNRLALEHYVRTGKTHAASCIREQCSDWYSVVTSLSEAKRV